MCRVENLFLLLDSNAFQHHPTGVPTKPLRPTLPREFQNIGTRVDPRQHPLNSEGILLPMIQHTKYTTDTPEEEYHRAT